MPAPTDLTWAQLDATRGDAGVRFLYVTGAGPDDTNTRLMIDVSSIIGKNITNLNQENVVNFAVKFLEICRKAQEELNTGKLAGERLTAFPVPTTSTPTVGQVPIDYKLTARAVLSSATDIKGATA